MKKYNLYYICSVLLLVLLLKQHPSKAQQAYLNNDKFTCDQDLNITNGYRCNGVETSCQSYLTFRSTTSYYSAASIGSLLSVDASVIAEINSITKFQPIPTEPRTTALIIIPVSCSCSGQYYQQISYYTVQSASETYLIIANNTCQGLTTCQAMMRSNTDKTLRMGVNVNVPLRCACPTLSQTASGFKYLLTYVLIPGENISEIADRFGVDGQSVLDANEISEDSLSAFTTVLIPLKSSPIVSVFSSNYSCQIQPPIPL